MSVIPNVFDKYERVARVYPALIVGSPLILAVLFTFPAFPDHAIAGNAAMAVVIVALLYAFTHVVRATGRSLEKTLWQEWGGPPSTRLMLWSDTTMSDQWKEKAHGVVASSLSISLHSRRKESHDVEGARKLIWDAFTQVRTILDLEKPDGKHQVHNCEYGFARNLLGACPIGIVVSLAAAAWCVVFWIIQQTWWSGVGAATSLLFLVGFIAARKYWLPSLVKMSADRYAEKAWTIFIEVRGGGEAHSARSESRSDTA